jgi:hypothetical protein
VKNKTRELLVTTKAAQHWQDDFDTKVDELMTIMSRVDNEDNVLQASEMMDVYHSVPNPPKRGKKTKVITKEKPFAFLVFRN